METLPEGREKNELLNQHEALVKPARATGSTPSSHVAGQLQARAFVPAPEDALQAALRDDPVLPSIDPNAWFAPSSRADVDQAYAKLFENHPAPIQL
ncbi:MAG: hypothetical protein GWN66_12580, partial [Pseudomonas stutzeri]|nr:hypothetical protein [Stutzerimonas stutzeri]